MVVLLYRPNLIFVLLISMASNIENPLYYSILCALAAYCLRRAAIMKRSPCDLSSTTINSCSLRLSTKASEVGVRIRFIRQPIPDEFFFFQAEDGIRDLTVTGVQTCALPI